MMLRADDVIQHFDARTGDTLTVAHVFKGNALLGGFAALRAEGRARTQPAFDDPAIALDSYARTKYGDFTIVVFDDIHRAKEDGLLRGLEPPTEEGIRWQYHAPEEGEQPSWSAVTLYGNVMLKWWTPRKQIDARWRRLDAVLRALKPRPDPSTRSR